MNFVFVSPQFPTSYWNFCDRLKQRGVTVLGLSDAPYDSLPEQVKNSLTEYYRVDSMEDYDQMVRALGYFTHQYGKIDWLESNNEYWLTQDARLRTDFNITTGMKSDQVANVRRKSAMKAFYKKAGVPTARYHMVLLWRKVLRLRRKSGIRYLLNLTLVWGQRKAISCPIRMKCVISMRQSRMLIILWRNSLQVISGLMMVFQTAKVILFLRQPYHGQEA